MRRYENEDSNKLWHLESIESRIHKQTLYEPQEYSCKLFADCEIIVDTSLIDEDAFGTKDITVEQYLSEFVEDAGSIDDLIDSCADLTIDKKYMDIRKARHIKVTNVMKIFIHEEVYNSL